MSEIYVLIGGKNHGKVLRVSDNIQQLIVPVFTASQTSFIEQGRSPNVFDLPKRERYIKYYIRSIIRQYRFFALEGLDPRVIHNLWFDSLRHSSNTIRGENYNTVINKKPQRLPNITVLLKDSADDNPEQMLERILAKGRRHIRGAKPKP